jgi:hypothetical protein
MGGLLMSRRMVGDDQEVYRVIVVRRRQRENPDWERGNVKSPYFLYDGEEYETSYGPYNSIGSARGQLTRQTVALIGRRGGRPGVVSGRIEKGETVWRVVI